MEKQIKIALAGNPNSGKTTLFNALTGSNQFVGNWPGVTVEKKEGKLKGDTGPMQRAWIDSGKLRETYKESNDRKTGTFYRIHIFADGIGVLYRRSTHVFHRLAARLSHVGGRNVV